MDSSASEVARLRQQIEEEIEAMQRGFKGFAAGVARHDFIRARMDRVGDHMDELAQHVGSGDATQITCEIYIHTMTNEGDESGGQGGSKKKRS